MPKGKKKRGRKRKGKKKKKFMPEPPPLHELTSLYNKLIEEIEEFKATRNKARKKRIEAWYMVREMMSLRHDQDIYHKYLDEKMKDLEDLFNELQRQLNEEKDAVNKIVEQRKAEMDRIIAGYRERSLKAEEALKLLKQALLEFEPLMRELAALLARIKELQALIPIYELEANIKTRHLKNQFLMERSKLHNHLENELYILIMTLRSHLMPIFSDHMTSMEIENRCHRWALGILDETNFKLYRDREALLEKRNRLNMEREYLPIDWAFNKIAQVEARRKEERLAFKEKKKKVEEPEEECELSIAFRAYLSKKLGAIEEAKEKERRAQLRREARERRLKREAEKKKRAEILELKRAGQWPRKKVPRDEEEDELGEWGELEYYEDDEGNWVIATPSRMLQHKAILENRALAEMEGQVDEIKKKLRKRRHHHRDEFEDGEGSYSSSYSSSSDSDSSSESWSGESEGSLASLPDLSDDFGELEHRERRRRRRKKHREDEYEEGEWDGEEWDGEAGEYRRKKKKKKRKDGCSEEGSEEGSEEEQQRGEWDGEGGEEEDPCSGRRKHKKKHKRDKDKKDKRRSDGFGGDDFGDFSGFDDWGGGGDDNNAGDKQT